MALLLIIGGIVAVKVRRYKKMLETVTLQIHTMPNQQAYDDLTDRIQRKAQEVGIEQKFRQFLEKQGLQGEGSWIPQKKTPPVQ